MATSQNILNVSKHIQGVDLNEFPAHYKSNVKVCNAHYMHNFGVMVVYTKVNLHAHLHGVHHILQPHFHRALTNAVVGKWDVFSFPYSGTQILSCICMGVRKNPCE